LWGGENNATTESERHQCGAAQQQRLVPMVNPSDNLTARNPFQIRNFGESFSLAAPANQVSQTIS